MEDNYYDGSPYNEVPVLVILVKLAGMSLSTLSRTAQRQS